MEPDDAEVARSVARRLAGRWRLDPDDAEQIATIAVWRAREQYDPGCGWSWPAVARRAARNALVDEVRRILGRHGGSKLDLTGYTPPTGEGSVVETAHASDEAAQLRAAVSNLPSQHRFVLSGILDGETCEALAGKLGVGLHRVWQLRREAEAEVPRLMVRRLPPVKQRPMIRHIGPRVTYRRRGPSIVPLATLEREAVEAALLKTGGGVRAAAQELGMGKATLYRRLREWGMDPSRFR